MKYLFDIDKWREIWITITHNKSRSFLTAFGVFWGMFMLVLMVGAGNGLSRGIEGQVEGFAKNSCFFWAQPTSVAYKGFQKNRRWDMLNSDISIMIKNVPEAEYISPVLFGGSGDENAKNVVRGEKGGNFQIKGVYPNYNEIEQVKILEGRFINDIDIEQNRKVCLIGQRVQEVLFAKGESAVGKSIKVNGIYFNIIGVCEKMSNASIGGNPDESVNLPFTTMQKAFNQGNIIHFIAATAKKGIEVKIIQDKIRDTLKNIHQISPTDEEAVGTMNVEEQFKMFSYLTLGINALIWIVGLGTLLAGAIGVSNIMLVTVRERTKEIGIRRALGATPRSIISQIITESIVLTFIAGMTAIILGVLILAGVTIALSQGDAFIKETQITFNVAMTALFVLIAVGAIAGYLPASRAMQIKAIEAIREE